MQKACLTHVVTRVSARSARTVLVFAPDNAMGSFQSLFGDRVEYWPQGDGDLGARLARASGRAFDAGAEGVVFLGADCVTLSWSLLEQMPKLVAKHDVVLGPAEDGGYYLLATSGHCPALFEGIDWGTNRVCDQTIKRAKELRLSVRTARIEYDIDRIADLQRAIVDLSGSGCDVLAEQLRRVLEDPDANLSS